VHAKEQHGDWVHPSQLGNKDRCVPLPQKIIPKLKAQIERVANLHAEDLKSGAGWVWLPYALADKYPQAGRTLAWQFVFPAPNISRDSHPRLPAEEQSASEHVTQGGCCAGVRLGFRFSGQVWFRAM